MSAPRPFRRETLSSRDALARLRALGAREQIAYRSGERQLYWSGSHRVWIDAMPTSEGHYALSFYRGCPCSGS